MPIIITNFILPLALFFIRTYINNPSKKHDGQILDTIKKSMVYLSRNTSTSANGKNVAEVMTIQELPQYSDLKGGL